MQEENGNHKVSKTAILCVLKTFRYLCNKPENVSKFPNSWYTQCTNLCQQLDSITNKRVKHFHAHDVNIVTTSSVCTLYIDVYSYYATRWRQFVIRPLSSL